MKKPKTSLPSYIYLLGRKIDVFESVDPIRNEKGDILDGSYEHDLKRIVIDNKLLPDDKFKIFSHECAHSYLTQLGLDQLLNEREVESVCNIMAMLVEDLIKGCSGLK